MKFSFSPSSTDLKKWKKERNFYWGISNQKRNWRFRWSFMKMFRLPSHENGRSPAYYLSGTGALLSGTELGGNIIRRIPGTRKVTCILFKKTG